MIKLHRVYYICFIQAGMVTIVGLEIESDNHKS